MSRLWEKGLPVNDAILRFCVGDDHLLDARLVSHDVKASIAHARMLKECGHLSSEDFDAIRGGLEELRRGHEAGEWEIRVEDEDVHTALESRLSAAIGSAGERIHLGRSRNDQVMAALRLYLLDVAEELATEAESCAAAVDTVAERQGELAIPGYTHLQRAMPSTVSLWAKGYSAELRDDAEGLRSSRRRLDLNPLGSAAGYGVPVVEIDRERSREFAGFARTQEPVTAVQLSRGKAEAGLLFEIVLVMQDLGRLAAELCLFASAEFGFVRLPDQYTTGSSIMPQKRNPDVFELLRARSVLVAADLQAVLAVPAKLPSGYHRDLQLMKEPLFRGIDSAHAALAIMTLALDGVRFDEEKLAAASDPELEATARAYELVRDEGIPFRQAYQRIAIELANARRS